MDDLKHPGRLSPLTDLGPDELMLHEIYASVQGESSWAGVPCTFIRTTACNLRCTYCDTPHAFTQGRPWKMEDVLAEVERIGIPLVEVTGGEPLLQANVLPLMSRLADAGHTVLLETSGALDIRPVDERVVRIVDVKTPSSGEVAANLYDNFSDLRPTDELKFVLGNREDYDWAKALIAEYDLGQTCPVLMGCVFGKLEPRDLAGWIVADRINVRMQIQMHKYVWDPTERGV